MHDTNRELWGSSMIDIKQQSIYFAGDTTSGNHFAEIYELFPRIKHVFMPIGAYRPSFMMQGAHISPAEDVPAFHELGGNIDFIPVHHGIYDLLDEPIGEPLRLIQELYAEKKLQGELLVSAVGETVAF
jgi:L-ascorbate metabolism protein UlaG (beta-lactamase superfamily)